MRSPRAAVPTPEPPTPPPRTLTREEIIKLVQDGGLRSRFMVDCRARGGRACCGQGGCCGLPQTRLGAHVWMVPPSVDGELEMAAVGRVIARYGRVLDECYTREALEPWLLDSVHVRLEIANDGSVVRSTGRGFDDAVARCAAEVLAAARFPAPRSGTVVASASFTFR